MKAKAKRNRNYDPFQYAAFSGSAALDYLNLRKEEPTAPSIKRHFFPPSDAPDYNKPDWASEMSDLEDTSHTQEIPEDVKEVTQKYVPNIISRPLIKNRFLELQKWEGIVLQISKDSMVARLIDLSEKESEGEVEFALDEIHSDDLPLVKPGAIFYWTIGYLDKGGQRIRASIIRFRRLPRWRTEELDAAKKDAEYTQKLFKRGPARLTLLKKKK